MTEPTPTPTAPLFVLQLGPNEAYVRLDGGEEDSTERTSDEIRQFCAEIKQRFAEDLEIVPDETQMSHECLEGGEETNAVPSTKPDAAQHRPLTEGHEQPQSGPTT
jgi:hypothetical protein